MPSYSGLIGCNPGIQAKFIITHPMTKASKHCSHSIVSEQHIEYGERQIDGQKECGERESAVHVNG